MSEKRHLIDTNALTLDDIVNYCPTSPAAAEAKLLREERDALLKLLPAVRYAVRMARNRNNTDSQVLEWTNLLADANDIERRK